LDLKLWVALACPTQGLEFDRKTLELIDTDKDGRIRAPEIIAAAKWACGCLRDADDLVKGRDRVLLASINDGTAEGKQLLASVRQILRNLGKPEAAEVKSPSAAVVKSHGREHRRKRSGKNRIR